ncbi:shikimate kinase [Blastopirellula sp. JC732]|uniref:Shikimate kinase n=1 Tax=Blastopirellula sediminis TaxID=2894196 RepID=A0A9X1MRH8_9BACT|nr:shikimate kinase [Blastopirellula sediminis]MCC9605289.1 shikimate kinase [Blastopirellula sediminis]MCC9631411.1 shikimate kinase [Blastopirellula sediminis]
MNLALVGFRGVGKSHVARLLGERLGWPAVDADVELQTRAQQTIAEIFAADGEQAFRDLETAVVADLTQRDQQVIALGGGAVLRAENRAAIRSNCFTVWLTADAETILARISADTATAAQRPGLTDKQPLDEIQHLLEVREPLYREAADAIVDTQTRTPEEAADEIYQLFAPKIESAS